MPTFLGSLRPTPDQANVSKLLSESGGVGAPSATTVTDADNAGETKEANTEAADGKWKPSGGKKLSTGLAICLENSASGCTRPCVLDLKLGARLWDDDAPHAKRQKLDEVAASTTSGSLGFRVAGMRVWVDGDKKTTALAPEEEGYVTVDADGYKSYDKHYGRQFRGRDDVRAAFEAFLPAPGAPHRDEITRRFVDELESVVHTLEQTESRMYSASLLFVYEGDAAALGRALEFEKRKEAAVAAAAAAGEDEDEGIEVDIEGPVETDENDEEIEPKVHDLRMIDFAHASWTPGQGPDENALRGVRSALEILKEVAAQ